MKLDDLLKLLDHEEVQQKIRAICGASAVPERKPAVRTVPETEYQRLQNELRQVRQDCRNLQTQAENYRQQCRTAEQRLETLQSETKRLRSAEEDNQSLRREVQDSRRMLDTLKTALGGALQCYRNYRELPDPVRYGLEDVICDESIVLFIASCTSEVHLKAIWNCIADLLETDRRSAEVLKGLFDYFFEVFNQALPQPMFRRDDTEEGDAYDDDLHIRCTGSATSGEVSEVLLRGYYAANTHNVVCRSVVRVS